MSIATLGDPARHFWITRSVARALGVSLSDAIADGLMTGDDYARMVTRCRTCQHVSACEQWLGQQAERAGQAPDWCLNLSDFSRALCSRMTVGRQ